MGNYEPVGVGEHGVAWAYRFSEADMADIYMGAEMYAASPDGEARWRSLIADLPNASSSISGYLET